MHGTGKFLFAAAIGLLAILFTDPLFAADADAWRQIRHGAEGYSAVQGRESGMLIQSTGQDWRLLRNGPVAVLGAWGLVLTLLALGGFFLLHGRIRLDAPRTGITVPRWSVYERILHWTTAILFLLLMCSGLLLLYGRETLLPLLGHGAFSSLAAAAKTAHNYSGPLFIVGLLLMLIAWLGDNIPTAVDRQWLKSLGGVTGDRHASAGRMNAGEKGWFWLLMLAGIAVSISGLILDFSNFGQPRSLLQISHVIHSVSALLLSAGALGHIYIGSIGTEGALEGMTTGRVDTTWAEQHHDLWYEQLGRREKKS